MAQAVPKTKLNLVIKAGLSFLRQSQEAKSRPTRATDDFSREIFQTPHTHPAYFIPKQSAAHAASRHSARSNFREEK